jgi:hypothetical protein
MKRFIYVAAVVLALVVPMGAEAKGGRGGHGHGGGAHGRHHGRHHVHTHRKAHVRHVHARYGRHGRRFVAGGWRRWASWRAGTRRVVGGYWRNHGVRSPGGYYYTGRYHSHWTRTLYSKVYNRTIYWDPGLQLWYYWDAATGCYYPVSYLN